MRKIPSTTGLNFTCLEFDTEQEYKDYIESNKDLFRFVGYSGGQQENGTWKLVY